MPRWAWVVAVAGLVVMVLITLLTALVWAYYQLVFAQQDRQCRGGVAKLAGQAPVQPEEPIALEELRSKLPRPQELVEK